MFNFKKLFMSTAVLTTLATVSGCGTKSVAEIFTGYTTTISSRIDWNMGELRKLKNIGLISEDAYNSVEVELTNRKKTLTRIGNSNKSSSSDPNDPNATDNQGLPNDIKTACSAVVGKIEVPKDKKEEGKVKTWNESQSGVWQYLQPDKDTKNIVELIAVKDKNSDALTALDSLVKTEIYTLKMNKNSDLSDIITAVKAVKAYDADPTAHGNVSEAEYDKAWKLIDQNVQSSGVTLLDSTDSLFRTTTSNDKVLTADGAHPTKSYDDTTSEEVANDPTKAQDLAVFCGEYAVVSFRLHEMNGDTVDKIVSEVGNSTDSYLVLRPQGATSSSKIIKLVYPVSYIDELEYDGSNVKANIKESEYININIMTGQLTLTEKSNRLTDDERANLQSVLNTVGTYHEDQAKNMSSFVGWDNKKVKMKDHKGALKEYETATVLLKDYLEYTYLPGLMGADEKFVALGRRIRINDLENDGTVKDTANFAKFIDRSGYEIEGASSISVGDLLDYRSGNKDYDEKAIRSTAVMPAVGKEISLNNSGTSSSNNSSTGNTSNTGSASTSIPAPSAQVADNVTWEQDSNGKWKLKLSDASYAQDGWYMTADGNGKYHYFHFTGGLMDSNTDIKPNSTVTYHVDDNGYLINPDDNQPWERASGGGASTVASSTDDKFKETLYSKTIKPTATFPIADSTNNVYVDRTDGNDIGTSNGPEMFYGMCISTNVFTSQLYSGWIHGEDESKGNLEWWNAWLESAKMRYHIDIDALEKYLNLNFTADMLDGDDTTIVLNKDTLEKIQNQMNSESRVSFVGTIRTIPIILGYLAYAEAFLLLAAWVIDTTFSFEFKIMPVISFGTCVAVMYADDVAEYGDVKYLTFSSVLARALTLVGIGVALTAFNIIGALGKIIGTALSIAKFLLSFISG